MTYPAAFSPDRVYRYTLWRGDIDDTRGDYVQFIGLNPSTADEALDDATIRRCRQYTKLWGFDRMVMTNLFAYRSRDPKNLKALPHQVDAIGKENDRWLLRCAEAATLIVVCWGTKGVLHDRGKHVSSFLRGRDVQCFGYTNNHQPLHPLRLPYDIKLQRWTVTNG